MLVLLETMWTVWHRRLVSINQHIPSVSMPQNRITTQSNAPKCSMNVFNRKAKSLQKSRSSLLPEKGLYQYLKEEVGFRVYDRICDVSRQFPLAVDLGSGTGNLSKHLLSDMTGHVVQYDMTISELEQSQIPIEITHDKVEADEEWMPFRNRSIDLFCSSLSLHWVNDLPGTFKQVHNCLVDDGCFIGAMLSGDSLYELRVSLQLAEMEREGGFAPHISPFTAAQDLGSLLNRAGFAMTTIDVDEIVIRYPTMFELMNDVKGMGENNCAWSRRPMIPRETLLAAAAIYKDMYGQQEEGIPATFQIIYFIGWKPHANQQKPAKRGSGKVSMKNISSKEQIEEIKS